MARSKLIIGLSIATIAGISVVLYGYSTQAAVTTLVPNSSSSPTPVVHTAGARPQHYILAHNINNDGHELRFAVYYPAYDPSKTIRIYRDSGSGGLPVVDEIDNISKGLECRMPWQASVMGASVNAVHVTISVPGAGSVTYNIPRNRVCPNPGGTGWRVTSTNLNLRTATSNNHFYGRYQLPLGTATPDPETGLYKAEVYMRFSNHILGLPNFSSTAMFRARAESPDPGTYIGPVGNLNVGVGSRTLSASQDYYQHRFDFGSPCSQTGTVRRAITIRDPDNYNASGGLTGTQGNGARTDARPMRFYITENGAPLPQVRYLNVQEGTVSMVGGIAQIRPTGRQNANGQSPDTNVEVDMLSNGKYELIAVEVYYSNIIQVRLPTDAIYNAIDCSPGTELRPSVTIGPNPALVGNTITSRATITNNGSVNPGETDWAYRMWLDDGNGTYDAAADTSVHDESGNETVAADAEWFTDITHALSDPSFTQICASLELAPVDPSTAATPNPAIACVPIGKQPLVQISGGDLVVRNGSVNAPSVVISGGRYGSWIEYGVFGSAQVMIHSGAALMAVPNAPNDGLLTFANTTNPKGNYGNLGVVAQPTLPAGWPVTSPGATMTISGSSPRTYDRTGNLTINASGNLLGSYIIQATGNIHIAGDITYANVSYGTDDDLPQVIIKASNITIASNVRRIDAWLIATTPARDGVLNTCTTAGVLSHSPYYDGLSRAACDSKLTINGPVITDRLFLRRTAGADGTTTASRRAPAEVFNLRSDAYLWAYRQATDTQVIRTETVRELPPRF